jgi:hypothetical protein
MVTSNIVSFAGISGAGKIEAMAGFSAIRLAMIQDRARFSELPSTARNHSGCVAVTVRHAGQLADLLRMRAAHGLVGFGYDVSFGARWRGSRWNRLEPASAAVFLVGAALPGKEYG